MFSNKNQLRRRTPVDGTNREEFLSLLVDEYLNSSSYDAKSQVLANLANFSYDPVNYGFIRDVGVLDIFLHVVKTENDEQLLHFASAGICNLCVDPLNADYIHQHGGLASLLVLLNSQNIELVANIITILIYICTGDIKTNILKSETGKIIKKLQKSEEKRISNLATIFVE